MVGRDLAREVTISEPRVYDGEGGPRIVALDTGIKRSIIRNFTSRGATLEIHPCTTPADELLATDPDVLVADEPTTLLDLANTRRIADLLFSLSQQLVLVTHDLDLALRCDRALLIDGGRVTADGTAREVVDHYRAGVG